VRAGVILIHQVLVPDDPARTLAPPQGECGGAGGVGHAKVRPRVCLVVHFLATGGHWCHRIVVLLQHHHVRLCKKFGPKVTGCVANA
jgi:hypothetical protein